MSAAGEPRTEAGRGPSWSFKEGTLRERIEWCRVQHQLGAEWIESGHKVEPATAEFHRACVGWYAQMVSDLDEAEAARTESRLDPERMVTAMQAHQDALGPLPDHARRHCGGTCGYDVARRYEAAASEEGGS